MAKFLRFKYTSTGGFRSAVSNFKLKNNGVDVLNEALATTFTFASDSYYNAEHDATHITSATGFIGGVNPYGTITISSESEFLFNEIDFIGFNNENSSGRITNFIVETSTDGLAFTQVYDSGALSFNDSIGQAFVISPPTTPVVPVAPVSPTQTIDQMINDAFVSAKTYIDSKDAGLKAYTDAALAQLMNTTDLTAKLSLLEQINTILDGDAATAGFQAWQAALTRLNAIETTASDFKIQTESALQNINNLRISSDNAFTAKIDANKIASDSADSAIAARVLTLETTTHTAVTASVSTLDTKVTTSVATVQTGINANFAAMKAKAAILFAV